MDNSWFYFALLSPAIFAIVNLIDDNLLRVVYRSPYFGAIISGFFGLLPLVMLFFYPLTIPSFSTILFGLLAGFLTVTYYLYYFRALQLEAPSVVIALFGFSPAFVPFLAYAILGETLSTDEYLGFILILGASIALSAVNIKHFKFSQALYLITFASFIYAIISILGKIVYSQVNFFSGYMFFSIGMGLGALFLSIFFKEGRVFYREFSKIFKKWIIVFFFVELIGISAELTNNYAISKGPVTLVKVIEGIQPMYVLLIALALYPFFPKYFREAAKGGRVKKLLLMIMILIGLYFVNQ